MKVICDCLNWKFTAKITYHLHIYPQFIYESFHIHYIISLLSRENKNSQLTSLPMCGFIAQLVEHRTGIAEVTGSNPVEALIFFRLLHSNCLNWKFTAKITYHLQKIYCKRPSNIKLNISQIKYFKVKSPAPKLFESRLMLTHD